MSAVILLLQVLGVVLWALAAWGIGGERFRLGWAGAFFYFLGELLRTLGG